MIQNVKIYGERNSGTNFLEELIKKNVKGINICSPYYKYGWKHGFPRHTKNINSTLFIFIIRDLEPWLKSMYVNPYHYKPPANIVQFLNGNIIVDEYRRDHDVIKYRKENGNIVKLRYAKIEAYLDFFKTKVKYGMFINLEDLQKDNKKFLSFLRDKYKLKIGPYISIKRHTKNGQLKRKNRKYSIVLPDVIPHKNNQLELFVHNLKQKYNSKNTF